MDPATALPKLLMAAWLLPLASFAVISIGYSVPQLLGMRVPYPAMKNAAYIAVAAIVMGFVLSCIALFGVWLPAHPLGAAEHHAEAAQAAPVNGETAAAEQPDENNGPPTYYAGDWYSLGVFGKLKITIGYYIDTLTLVMFCLVTLIASCVHIYAIGYMHDEMHDFVDHEVTLAGGDHLHRRGRFHRFFQYLSLFSFSMLGICIAGNLAMVFVFWELVGICSYFLIGFYIERKSASNAANKAFIVNRIGDFGMLIGMMALWSTLGTFSFGDITGWDGKVEPGMFSLLHDKDGDYRLAPTLGMIAQSGHKQISNVVRQNTEPAAVDAAVKAKVAELRKDTVHKYGHWLLFVAGVGVFCGCMGKSAQFPLHVWLPDAMEGPTPVSALVHSATMVAAGVFLVGRVYPIFTPEALLVIATIGCITLFIAATIAITAVDIKRVLAYSTVSQLGYMMLSLGLGGWVAGLFHLITHAFFKSLMFLCSGSVIHAVHTNDMREMGGLRMKMPITAYTMLIGCLAISGVGIPFFIGLSGFHSKDAIMEQAFSHISRNAAQPMLWLLFLVPAIGAGITPFYMFRLWYMTFAGEPRDHHRFDHAHESPWIMTGPLVLLSVFAICIGWTLPFTNFGVQNLLEQARPIGTLATTHGTLMTGLTVPKEHDSHAWPIALPAGLIAITMAILGILMATIVYLWKLWSADKIRVALLPLYSLCWHKWWFDELYDWVFVRPTLLIASFVATIVDRGLIDGIIHWCAAIAKGLSAVVSVVGDRFFIDNFVDTLAEKTWDLGLSLRSIQTGRLRQYVMFIVIGTVVLFLIASVWRYALAAG
jgi:NADH:ubiquinone oxidoreductase subunit 5 (subunit L)/multisubunit Na+/H+ antiporter MnhA subunit